MKNETCTNVVDNQGYIYILIVDVVEFAFSTSMMLEPKLLVKALKRPDRDKYLKVTIEEVKVHIKNKMWEVV